jgi:hypothetical protein
MSEDSPRETRVTFRRRRRKRRLQISGISEGPREVLSAVEHMVNKRRKERRNAKIFKDGDEADAFQKIESSKSVPEMLYMRATGGTHSWNFPFRMRKNDPKKRSIRFSQLESPESEAVLALEQSGSYFITLAGNMAAFDLALRVYAVPSPSSIESGKFDNEKGVVSPLVTTVPISMPCSDGTNHRYVMFHLFLHAPSFCFVHSSFSPSFTI